MERLAIHEVQHNIYRQTVSHGKALRQALRQRGLTHQSAWTKRQTRQQSLYPQEKGGGGEKRETGSTHTRTSPRTKRPAKRRRKIKNNAIFLFFQQKGCTFAHGFAPSRRRTSHQKAGGAAAVTARPRARGEIGRRARLRIWCFATCRFESYRAHPDKR